MTPQAIRSRVFLIPLLFFTSLRAADELPEPTISWKYPPEMTGSRVEVYRTIGDVKLNAHIFEPEDHAKTDHRPAAVFFFGGGWKGGTPGQFLPQCLHLAKRGMVAISVDYRVKSRHNVFPQDCVRDAKAAIRWVRANAERLGVDPDRIVAGGGSAGGHLAAATALLPGFEDDNNKGVSSVPNAMLLFNPAVVLAPVDGHPDLLTAEKFADIRERCDGRPQEVSPYHFVRAGLPPSIIFHGTNDEAVSFPTVQLFQKVMSAAGNRCELKAYEGQPHGFFNPGRWKDAAGARAKLHYYKTLAEVDAFLESLDYLTPAPIVETFDAGFDAKRFTTPIPNKNTEVRDGVLWTRGRSGGKYPPMVYLPVSGKDLAISFRYRHLGQGGMLWFFVDGDDGFGSVDHMLRVKLLRDGVQLQVDSHSLDPNHPLRQKQERPADKVSGAYRLNEFLPLERADLGANAWHTVKLVFNGESVAMSVDDKLWSKTLSRANFNAGKRKLLWMQNGGEKGIEIDDIHVEPSAPMP
ncbi:MAG TPA: hypothetical protein DIT13_07215 [Verrucomicrobiales bacterium]|nr:hypothetical protein [Verrucomicrobiales bacterium]HRJ08777.1 alpha/beta hydrolase [Prosthecobacter sp.]HRK15300.1 alpha/beta hydrolase [Prosthecobacter sp.]